MDEFFVKSVTPLRHRIRGTIQAGAHHGEEYDWLRGAGRFLLFEPAPAAFAVLKRRIGPDAIAEQLALGRESATRTLYTTAAYAGQSNSLLAPKLHLQEHPEVVFDGRATVGVVSLDRYLIQRDLEHEFNFLLLDVQGYELEVLAGADKTLASIDFIFTEVNASELYEGAALVDELDRHLADRHFSRTATAWTRHQWGDALYLKNGVG